MSPWVPVPRLSLPMDMTLQAFARFLICKTATLSLLFLPSRASVRIKCKSGFMNHETRNTGVRERWGRGSLVSFFLFLVSAHRPLCKSALFSFIQGATQGGWGGVPGPCLYRGTLRAGSSDSGLQGGHPIYTLGAERTQLLMWPFGCPGCLTSHLASPPGL